jgi:CheR methyltransferase-like protein
MFCRNVLIYSDQESKVAVLDRLARQIEPDGYLMLGAAEQTYFCAASGQRFWRVPGEPTQRGAPGLPYSPRQNRKDGRQAQCKAGHRCDPAKINAFEDHDANPRSSRAGWSIHRMTLVAAGAIGAFVEALSPEHPPPACAAVARRPRLPIKRPQGIHDVIEADLPACRRVPEHRRRLDCTRVRSP